VTEIPSAWIQAANAAVEERIDDYGVSLTDEAIEVIIAAARPLIETEIRGKITAAIRGLKQDYKHSVEAFTALIHAQTIAQPNQAVDLRRHRPLTDEPCGVIPTPAGLNYLALRKRQHPKTDR